MIVVLFVVVEFDMWYNGGEVDLVFDYIVIFILGNKERNYNNNNVFLYYSC